MATFDVLPRCSLRMHATLGSLWVPHFSWTWSSRGRRSTEARLASILRDRWPPVLGPVSSSRAVSQSAHSEAQPRPAANVSAARFSVALPEPGPPASAAASLPPTPRPAEQPSHASVSSAWEARLRGPCCGAREARRPRWKRATNAVQPGHRGERLRDFTSSTGSATRDDTHHRPLPELGPPPTEASLDVSLPASSRSHPCVGGRVLTPSSTARRALLWRRVEFPGRSKAPETAAEPRAGRRELREMTAGRTQQCACAAGLAAERGSE